MRTSFDDRRRLRPLPDADGLDHSGPPPGLAWERRAAFDVGGSQYRITIPCVLRAPVPMGVHPELTAELRLSWMTPGAARLAWRITSVVAAFHGQPGRVSRLTLAITAEAPVDGPFQTPDEDPQMRRDLDHALARTVPAATRPATDRPYVRVGADRDGPHV